MTLDRAAAGIIRNRVYITLKRGGITLNRVNTVYITLERVDITTEMDDITLIWSISP